MHCLHLSKLLIFDSVLRMICRRRDTKAPHFIKQGGALQAKPGSCPSRTTELPIGALASSNNFPTHLVFKRRVCNLGLEWLITFERRWLKNAVVGQNDAARDVVLELSNVAGPVMAH